MTRDHFINTIVNQFLIPAAKESDYHTRWKYVNRAAGMIVGYACYKYGASFSYTQQLMTDIIHQLESRTHGPNSQMIAGPEGLQKRVKECLEAVLTEKE